MPDDKYGEGGGGAGSFTPQQIADFEKALGLPPGFLAQHPELLQQIAQRFGATTSTESGSLGAGLQAIAAIVPPNYIQIDQYHWVDPANRRVYVLSGTPDKPSLNAYTEGESKTFLNNLPGGVGGAGGGGGGGTRLASDDPRYWDIQYQQLYQDALNMGLDSESARRQALATLITNRNNTQLGIAQTSADVAKTAADFAANPRDAVAELMYRNQVGGSTPFGDMTNNNFGEYGKALAEKAASIFAPVQKDLQTARDSAGQWPQPDFVNPAPAIKPILGFAKGGQLNFDEMYDNRDKPGFSPSSSEGGSNLNLHERAVVVGESGHIYATLGEKRPDGSVRAEQLQIKPLKSEMMKDKKMEEGHKAIVETQQQTMKHFAGGGTVSSTPDDFMEQLRQQLGRLGGGGGGVGSFSTPLPSLRLLAGAPANALANDPVLSDYTMAGYSALGIDPRTVQATIKRFTPNAPINNTPRISFG